MKRKTRITKTIIWDRYKQVDALHDIARMFDRYHSSILPLSARLVDNTSTQVTKFIKPLQTVATMT